MIFPCLIQPDIINADNSFGFLTQKDILWTDLTFKSSDILVSMVVKIKIKSPTEIYGNLSGTSGFEIADCSWKDKKVKSLTIETTARKMFFFHEKYVEQTWFNAVNGKAYQRIRYRKGNNPWIKTYCLTQKGVNRQKIKPENPGEKKEPPVKWTQRIRSFYPYPKDIIGSVLVSDPSFIFYLLSALEPDQQKTSFKICVFGKKQLHRLTVKHETSLPVKVIFKIHSPSSDVSVESEIISNIFSLTAEPMMSENSKNELFSLFGLEKDIRIYMDFSRRLPIRISGINTKIGKLVLDLSEVKIK